MAEVHQMEETYICTYKLYLRICMTYVEKIFDCIEILYRNI